MKTIGDDSSVQHADPVEEFLQHFGVKGMRWGVRKDRSTKVSLPEGSPANVKVTSAKPGKKIKTSGGQGHPPSPEALRAVALVQQAKKSGTTSLSNKDIKDAVTRMNLEDSFRQTAAKYNPGVIQRGKNFVATVVGIQKEVAKIEDLLGTSQGQQVTNAIKGAAKSAGAKPPKVEFTPRTPPKQGETRIIEVLPARS